MGPLELGARGGRAGGGARAARRSPPLRIAVCVRVITGLRPAGSEAREACLHPGGLKPRLNCPLNPPRGAELESV